MDELWLERMAEVLCCDKDPAAVVVAVKDLQDQLASAKRMIAKLRGRGDCQPLSLPTRMSIVPKAEMIIIDDPVRGSKE